MTIIAPFSGLAPQEVWRHFATLCAIPRPSKHEATLLAWLADWAGRRGLAARMDGGNLILGKNASPGWEDAPGIILQGHLDMVCQAQSGYRHDFHRDPIRPEREEKDAQTWIVARQTTLGADNGIGVALALAALEDTRLVHGPLEVLLTVDEEAGMGGARNLTPGALQGRYLLNLDTEEWGKFYLGCAGGVEVAAELPVAMTGTPADWQGARLAVDGLRGGHSGIDIHLPRAHAIHVLFTVLPELLATCDLALGRLEGGDAINALPRSAEALLAVPPGCLAALERQVREEIAPRLRRRWEEPGFSLRLEAAPCPDPAMPSARWAELLRALAQTPYGVAAMSADFPGVVETSNNLAPFRITPQGGTARFFARSLKTRERDRLAERIGAQIEAMGGSVRIEGACPPWEPRPDSALLARCRTAYREEFGAFPTQAVIHAGLECGLFAQSHPHLEMLSFGPDIRGAHAPGERVHAASVERCWRLLKRLLESCGRQ
jgi:dipeptidase D